MSELRIVPATAERWPDLERLFGANGACGGCWCMWWRQSSKEHAANKGEGNRLRLKALVEDGEAAPGLLAYAADETGELQCAGWIAVAPRGQYPRLNRSSIAKPVDDTPVWVVSCLFIAKGFRRQGLSSALIDAAAQYAFSLGATCVEGYPFEPKKETAPAFIWTGTTPAYIAAGFTEVARHNPTRPVMRRFAS
jgi:GNAT superfamily N-acetyltransferase